MTIKKKKGLGRGLEVLLGSAPDFSADPSPVSSLPITRLQAGKYQPRNRMDEGALNELAQSIRCLLYTSASSSERWRCIEINRATGCPAISSCHYHA